MASLPPVKLDTHEDWFNLLMTVLHQQAEQNPYEEYREMAQKLIDQFMRYGRPFVDSDHAPCVALRMYPKEAGNTIWLLLPSGLPDEVFCFQEHHQSSSMQIRSVHRMQYQQ